MSTDRYDTYKFWRKQKLSCIFLKPKFNSTGDALHVTSYFLKLYFNVVLVNLW